VGRRGDVVIPRGAQLINVKGSFVLPGLVNAHDHLSWDVLGSETIGDIETQMRAPDAYLALRAARNGANYLRSGVTTVRVLGDVRFIDLQYRRAFEEDLVPGPRIVAAGPWVVATHGWITYPGIPTCDGPDEVRKFIRRNFRAGADLVKMFIGGELVGQCNTNPHLTYMTKEEIQSAIGEAHSKEKMVTAHVMSSRSPGFKWAVEAGIDVIEHGIWFEEEDFALMKKQGTLLVMAGGRWLESGLCDEIYPDMQEILRRWHERVFGSGVCFAVGVDICGMEGAMQDEIERLVRFGHSAQDALVAATRNGAKVCDLEDQLGTLQPGKLADVLVVDSDPLSDIRGLRKVRMVLKGGKVYYCRNGDELIGVVQSTTAVD